MSTKNLTHKAIAEALSKNTPLTTDQRATLLTLVNDDEVWQRRHDEMAEQVESLRAALEVSQAATNAAVSKAQWQARTNAELNAQGDTIRRLKAELCNLMNDGLGA